jgi:hypothetical protein
VFDELGVDHIFYDEAQAVKNLATPTKMDRVAGIQSGGSERSTAPESSPAEPRNPISGRPARNPGNGYCSERSRASAAELR